MQPTSDTNRSVFVIDDDSLSRESVKALVESMGIHTIAFESAEEFLATYNREQRGCIIADLRLRGMSGIELLDRLVKDNQSIPMILITGFARTHLTVRAVKNGAVTVLEKPYDDEDLWNAIRKALDQEEDRHSVFQRHHELGTRFQRLSSHEKEVLDMIVDGLTNRQIADKLNVSTRTIEARRHNVFQKTEAKSIAHLVRMTVSYRLDTPHK